MSDPFLEADLVPICRVPDCGRIVYVLKDQLCQKHYVRYLKHGDTETVLKAGARAGSFLPTHTGTRLFGVIATYGDGSIWTIKDVKASSPDVATDYHARVLPDSRVLAVGLLGGSGHALKWMTRAIPLPRYL